MSTNEFELYPYQKEMLELINSGSKSLINGTFGAHCRNGLQMELERELMRQREELKPFRIQYQVDAENKAAFFKGKCSLCNRPLDALNVGNICVICNTRRFAIGINP